VITELYVIPEKRSAGATLPLIARISALMAVAAVYFENKFGRNLVLPLNMRPSPSISLSSAIRISNLRVTCSTTFSHKRQRAQPYSQN
jgi:hypothetical protein